MEIEDLPEWLVRNAGPIIRYRTLVDIIEEQDVGRVGRALRDLNNSSDVKKWLSFLQPNTKFQAVHVGKPEAYENTMGNLVQLGLRAGLQPFDNKTLPFRVWLSENFDVPSGVAHAVFHRTIVASFLAYAGYDAVESVIQFLYSRLDALYKFARAPNYDEIYVNREEFGLPNHPSLKHHQIINPELQPDKEFQLPWIHDIRGLGSLESIMNTEKLRVQLERIVEMILTERYQSLPPSYGVAWYGDRYYVVGWAVTLPGYRKHSEGRCFAELLLNLEMFAPFKRARESKWFKDNMEYLEQFRTSKGTYLFPRSWLLEKMDGYWVGGAYMGYDERDRGEKCIEYESTFRALLIKKRAGLILS